MKIVEHSTCLLAAIIGLLVMYVVILVREEPIYLTLPPVTRREKYYNVRDWIAGGAGSGGMCSGLLNNGSWTEKPISVSGNCGIRTPYAYCGLVSERRWKWTAYAVAKGAKHMMAFQIQEVLRSRWIAFVGDSIARKVLIALLDSLEVAPNQMQFDRHSDFEYKAGSVHTTFHWTPFPGNVTQLLHEWNSGKEHQVPDVVVVSVGLWHILYIHDEEDFKQQVSTIEKEFAAVAKKKKAIQGVWATIPEIHHDNLKTLQKRREMLPNRTDAYNKVIVEESNVLQTKGGLFEVLDIFDITYGALLL
eukprot:jgi/Picsp_1/6088/NSC_03442-R1_protein